MLATAGSSFAIHQSSAALGSLLDDLRDAHARLFAEIANMDALTDLPTADWHQFCAARWRISEASLARRSLAARIIDYLLTRVGAEQVASLKVLKAEDQAMLRTSAQHVSAWSLRAIQDDWRGYCRASRKLRAEMTAFLLAEQRVLFSILGTHAPDSGAAAAIRRDERVWVAR